MQLSWPTSALPFMGGLNSFYRQAMRDALFSAFSLFLTQAPATQAQGSVMANWCWTDFVELLTIPPACCVPLMKELNLSELVSPSES